MTISRTVVLLCALLTLVLGATIGPDSAGANPIPKHGRYLQRDPNASGQVVLNDATWFDGAAPMVDPSFVAMREVYANGLNLYTMLGNNPVMHHDPLGLSWDPFDMVEAIIFEHEVSKRVALMTLKARTSDPEMLRAIRSYEHGAFNFMMDFAWDRDVGILFSMVGGTFFARACFEEGTLVWTDEGPVPIEKLGLGDEVLSRPDPDLEPGEAFEVPIEPGSLSLVRLRYAHSDGSTTTIETLRPTSMVAAQGLAAGRTLPITVLELGIAGEAEVLGIEVYAEQVRADVPVVTTRFVTDAAAVVDLYLEGEEQPIGVTPNHRVYSVDRGTWVEAGELRAGERLGSAKQDGNADERGDGPGVLVVARVEPREGRVAVYNLEVSRYHTYFVGEPGVWVHNECTVTYSPRIAQRMREDPGGMHNFPFSFDRHVIDTGTRTIGKDGYNQYTLIGTATSGKSGANLNGVYEIGGFWTDDVFEITHRFFRPKK
ncbi:MAG: hypothetical protein KF838_13365 [Phycisphaeraceae bacterium]|nr:MAG: hypothetical protein KF838_13365 [Phycisphaeraceae bacterium]